MATTRTKLTDLPADELQQLLGLVSSSDTVELKLTVPESEQRSAIVSLGMDPLDAEIRQVFFFDTPDLTLYEHGVVARARRVQNKVGDSVVKLRPVVPAELPQDLRRLPSLGVEVDAMPGGYVCSASMKRKVPNDEVKDAASGSRRLRKLFSKDQRTYFAAHAPDGIELDDLSVLGPIFVLKLRFSPQGLERRLVAELWFYPDDTRILELSTKCAPAEMFQVGMEGRAYLGSRGVSLDGEQQTKTRTALEFFSKRLRGELTTP
jgi:hypothetical protein